MTSELTDTEHDAVDWLYEMGAIAPRHLRLANEAFGRHRETVRAEVVGEIVAWLREKAVIYRSAWAESVDPRASAVADEIEAKFGGDNGAKN